MAGQDRKEGSKRPRKAKKKWGPAGLGEHGYERHDSPMINYQ